MKIMSTVPKAVQAPVQAAVEAAKQAAVAATAVQAALEAAVFTCIHVTYQLIDSNRAWPLKRNVVGNVHYVGTIEFAIIVSFTSHGFEIHVSAFSHFFVIGVHATVQDCAPC
jgi:hypothetical protein